MLPTESEFKPRARKDGLVVRELSGELLVYDRERKKALCLNETAALIWNLCDGETSVSALRSSLEDKTATTVEEQVIWYALDQFNKDHLLEERAQRPADIDRMSRRELIQRIGLAASIPLVASIVAPNVFAAVSCTQTCSLPTDCTAAGCTNGCSGPGGHCLPN